MGTLGDLEKEAGIGPSHDERFAFWYRFKDLPTEDVLKSGVDELRRMIHKKQRREGKRMKAMFSIQTRMPLYERTDLFNCCPQSAAPDWNRFTNLELSGCIDIAEEGAAETCIEGGQCREDAHFFTIYGRLKEGGCEAITDIKDFHAAEMIGMHLCELSGLGLDIHC